ncbi:carbohydrate ABC transporter permease [Microbacterium azadirachtae]|uniref:Raffinose/stachyose/melibiose transport system permease protein n=1 Tax=Microbacterium azadirachtae TaxID=582680 RepID=A0A1I6G9R2_9MICO|nr:sugar ABC transporter permease [Microbacterium azadirachtae]SDL38365.1 raffinose/stachyose/melibiose transport system permease protein [Microbacterium azadirachtae]SEF69349.1 raffinose/stachyose/melibiose transport system permease protein [Microbacterium azadirachtae]SEF70069.1 raffinose/stachyose/melibiose transport system permease protein [Microbacterium azadirachtae]SFR38871.1 raffinose/stachyose/melibiose transport system permease protein [Microbacterium azadirachtae]
MSIPHSGVASSASAEDGGSPSTRTITTSRRRRREAPARRRSRRAGLLFAAPGLVLYAAVVLWPMVQSIQYSFYKWDGVTAAVWVGVQNYVNFFTDPVLRSTLGNVLVLLVFFALLPIALGLMSAALITRGKQPGMAIYRWIFFLPQVMTSVVIALLFKRMYAPEGPINEALRAIGLEAFARNWLGDFTWALPAVGLIGTWVTFGFCMVLFVSGAASISPDLYEAARMDGAGPVREFFSVTLPGLRGQIAVAMTLTITGALRAFDLIWITTRGGPGTSTQTPAVALYKAAFVNPNVGQAAAIGVVMAVLCLVIALVITRVSEKE